MTETLSGGETHVRASLPMNAERWNDASAPIDQAVEEDDVGIAFADRRKNRFAVG